MGPLKEGKEQLVADATQSNRDLLNAFWISKPSDKLFGSRATSRMILMFKHHAINAVVATSANIAGLVKALATVAKGQGSEDNKLMASGLTYSATHKLYILSE